MPCLKLQAGTAGESALQTDCGDALVGLSPLKLRDEMHVPCEQRRDCTGECDLRGTLLLGAQRDRGEIRGSKNSGESLMQCCARLCKPLKCTAVILARLADRSGGQYAGQGPRIQLKALAMPRCKPLCVQPK